MGVPKVLKELTVNQRWNVAKEKKCVFSLPEWESFGQRLQKEQKSVAWTVVKQTHHKLLHGTSTINDQKENTQLENDP